MPSMSSWRASTAEWWGVLAGADGVEQRQAPRANLVDPGADRLDHAHRLAADDVALLHPRDQAPVEVEVRPAHRGRGHPDDRVGRLLDRGIRHPVDPNVRTAMPHDCSHATRLPAASRPTPHCRAASGTVVCVLG
jgi:hypothetical protein